MVQTYQISAQPQLAGDIVLTPGSVSETAFENDPAATLSVSGGAAGSWTYEILADSTGGAFRIEGDRLVVDDNARLDFETAPEVNVTIRATDSSGQSLTETMTIAVTDEAIERRYSTGCEFVATETEEEWDSGVMTVALAGGGFALIWNRVVDSSTNDHAAVVRYFDADGTPASDEIVLLSEEFLSGLSATPLAQGGFLLTRSTFDQATGTGSIEAQAYDEAGNAVGPAMSTGSSGDFPVAVQLSSGGYAIGWAAGLAIHVQRFDSAGTPSGPEIVIDADSSFEPIDMVAKADGGFAVAWMQSPEFSNEPYQVKAQFFDSSGTPSGAPISVASGLKIETPTLVALADGSFVLGWAEYLGGNTFQLKALPIGADGLAGGPPVTLATYRSESQFGPEPSFAAHPDGGFVAMWPGAEDYPNNRIYYRFTGQQFDSSGRPIGPEFHPAEGADGGGIAILADGTIVTAWYGPDSHGQGVFARVYSPADERQATSGNDIIYGDEGANWIDGEGGNDALYGLGGNDELLGRSGNDSLYGGAGNDVLRGGGGNDVLDGGAGQDELRGRDGNDLYIVDDEGDTVVERADGGTDEVRTALASYRLAANVETLVGTASTGQALNGNALANVLIGGAGNDVLNGDSGADQLAGGLGNDRYYVGAGDTVTELAGQGTDEVRTALASYRLTANVERLVGISATGQALNGNALANVIVGGAGNDVLNGDSGADQLAGGLGNDRYYVGAGDSVTELAGQGTDEVRTALASYRLTAEVERLVGISATGQALNGNALANTLIGGAGNDVLNGDSGADQLAGGLGNDRYYVGAGDSVTELAGQGTDEVRTALATYTLTANVENLTGISATGQTLTGNALANAIAGGSQADVIRGGGGGDYLNGNGGADRFVYTGAAESTGTGFDQLAGFDYRVDKIDLPGGVSGWAAPVNHGRLAGATFDADLAASLDSALGANQAVLFRPDSGDYAGRLFAVIDANGDGAYQAGQDYVIEFIAPAVPIAPVTSFFA